METLAASIASKAGASVGSGLVRELVGLQSQQLQLLRDVQSDVEKLVNGPWRTASLRVEEAANASTPEDVRRHLLAAEEALLSAVGQERVPTDRRAMVAMDLALVHGLLGDLSAAQRWVAEAFDNQVEATGTAVEAAVKALNSRTDMIKSGVDGDFWSLVKTSKGKDLAGTERWLRERYEYGQEYQEPPPEGFLDEFVANDDELELGSVGRLARALAGKRGAAAANDQHRKWAWEQVLLARQGRAHEMRPFLAHVAIAEVTTEGGRSLIRLHRMARRVEQYRQAWVNMDPGSEPAGAASESTSPVPDGRGSLGMKWLFPRGSLGALSTMSLLSRSATMVIILPCRADGTRICWTPSLVRYGSGSPTALDQCGVSPSTRRKTLSPLEGPTIRPDYGTSSPEGNSSVSRTCRLWDLCAVWPSARTVVSWRPVQGPLRKDLELP